MLSYSSTIEQLSIDDQIRSVEESKRDALERVEENANRAWMQRAVSVLEGIARTRGTLMSDDVNKAIEFYPERTHDTRAMGAVMRRAQAESWITPTEDFKPSRNPKSNGCPRRVWRSKLFDLQF